MIRGTCGNCGGPVTVPDMWGDSIPPVPRCNDCGATAKKPFGATIPMNPPPEGPDFLRDRLNQDFNNKQMARQA